MGTNSPEFRIRHEEKDAIGDGPPSGIGAFPWLPRLELVLYHNSALSLGEEAKEASTPAPCTQISGETVDGESSEIWFRGGRKG